MKKETKVIEKWRCPNDRCKKWHDDPSFAHECCLEDIFGYGCSACSYGADSEYDVEWHIKDEHKDEPEEVDIFGLPPLTKAELEAAGQKPLFK